MMFHKDTKVAFVLPPKTGTTSLVDCLSVLGFKILPENPIGNNRHALPKEFLKIYPVLNEYKFYGFFRNPLDRFISLMSMIDNNIKRITLDNYASNLDAHPKIPPHKQVDWLDYPNTTVFDFDDFREKVSLIGKMYGHAELKVPKLNIGPQRITATDEMKEFVRHYYDADYQFAKRVLGKEYPT